MRHYEIVALILIGIILLFSPSLFPEDFLQDMAWARIDAWVEKKNEKRETKRRKLRFFYKIGLWISSLKLDKVFRVYSYKWNLSKKKVREVLIFCLSKEDDEEYKDDYRIRSAVEFWSFSRNSNLFSKREKKWIRKINEEVRKEKERKKKEKEND